MIDEWILGETVSKGNYSWTKNGKNAKSGRLVTLKFIEKNDKSWVKEQAKQV